MANVRNVCTRYISTQFHLVVDDLFETVVHTKDDESIFNAICNILLDFNRYGYAKYGQAYLPTATFKKRLDW